MYDDDEMSDEEFIDKLLDLFEETENLEVYYIDPLEVFGKLEYDESDDEHPDAKFWREIAEQYEREIMAHLKFQNLLLISLWQKGGLEALGGRGIYN